VRAGTSITCASEWNYPTGSRCARSPPFTRPSDISSNVKALARDPSCSSHQRGLPVLGRVRAATSFPDVSAPLHPSDSLSLSAMALVPLVRGLLHCRRLLCTLRADNTCTCNVPYVGDGSPVFRQAGKYRGEARISQVTGLSSSHVPWSNIPPDTTPFSPKNSCRASLLPSGITGLLASGKDIGFGATSP
jgi:hypothetical protein